MTMSYYSLGHALFEHYCRAHDAVDLEWNQRIMLEYPASYWQAIDAARVAHHYIKANREKEDGCAAEFARGYGEQGPQPRDFGRGDLLEILRVHAERHIVAFEAFVTRKSKADDAAFACSIHYLEKMR
jgi:hypothetical protein